MYKTVIVPLKCNKTDFHYLRKLNELSAKVWNYCVSIDKKYKEENGKFMGLSALENATKNMVPLHAAGIHHMVFKYLHSRNSMWKSRKAKHKNSRKVELPYKEKRFMPTGWVKINIRTNQKRRIITLTRSEPGKRKPKPIVCHVKLIPKDIVEIELVYKDKYYLVIKYKEPDNTNLIQSENSASIDLGEIHAITSIDKNGNSIIITNRKVRSLIRLRDKRQGKIKSIRSKCKKGSIRYKKYSTALNKIKHEFDRKILDAIHKQSRLFLNWCIENEIKTIYYGNVDGVSRNSKGKRRKSLNHKLHLWCFGKLIQQLENKLTRYGIELNCISEAYTSQTCPNCKSLNKPKGRTYTCCCGYIQHRDIVGSMNILNQYANISLSRYNNREYLQID